MGSGPRDLQLALRGLLCGDALIRALATVWRVLDSGDASGARNMATDAALMAHARRTGEGTLRTYGWSRPTLSLGRHERARGLYDTARLEAAGVDVVRRPTGGRALLHHRELTYSITAPCGEISLSDSYRAINVVLLDALARMGVTAVEAAPGSRALRPDGNACFAAPSPGELEWDGRKLIGSAQLREGGALLQHGSILIADDQAMIRGFRTGDPAPSADVVPAATVTEALGRSVSPHELGDALRKAFVAQLGATGPLRRTDPASLHHDLARLEDGFRDPEWTWRR